MADDEDDEDRELQALIRRYRELTPQQYTRLQERAVERAKILRARVLRDLFRAVYAVLWSWRLRRTAMAELSALDDRMLKDVGLHRSEIEAAVHGNIPDNLRPRRAA